MSKKAIHTLQNISIGSLRFNNHQAYPTAMEAAIAIKRASIPVHGKRRHIPVTHGEGGWGV
jgi:hypothetical protein